MKQLKKSKACVTEVFREKILICATGSDIVSEVVEEALMPRTKAKSQSLH
jgi:hypothetical protein